MFYGTSETFNDEKFPSSTYSEDECGPDKDFVIRRRSVFLSCHSSSECSTSDVLVSLRGGNNSVAERSDGSCRSAVRLSSVRTKLGARECVGVADRAVASLLLVFGGFAHFTKSLGLLYSIACLVENATQGQLCRTLALSAPLGSCRISLNQRRSHFLCYRFCVAYRRPAGSDSALTVNYY